MKAALYTQKARGKSKNSALTKILQAVLAAVAAVIFLGTVYAVLIKKTVPNYRRAESKPEEQTGKISAHSKEKSGSETAYTALGQIRALTSDGTLVVVEPWFSLSGDDRELKEELAQKSNQERFIIKSYFSKFTLSELKSMGEKKIKNEIMQLINDELVLGKIQNVYFDDYLFFE